MSVKRILAAAGVLTLIAGVVVLVIITHKPKTVADIGGYRLVYAVELAPGDLPDMVDRVIAVLRKRTDPRNNAGMEWQVLDGGRFEVRVPRSSKGPLSPKTEYTVQPDMLKRMLARTGKLSFRIAAKDGDLKEETVRYYKSLLLRETGSAPLDVEDEWQWFAIRGSAKNYPEAIQAQDSQGKTHLLLCNAPNKFMSARNLLDSAYPTADIYGKPAVGFEFNSEGGVRFERLTSENAQRPLAILIDDEVYSAPTIMGKIRDRGMISGHFTREDVDELVRVLDSGALPVRISRQPLLEEKIEPRRPSGQ